MVGDLLVGCVSLVTETVADGVDAVFFDNGVTFDDYVSDGSGSWRDTADELDLAAGEAVERRMGELLADPASGELHERVVAYLDEELLRWEGYTAAELGIDADAWATWALGSVSYEISSVYAYDDGTGSAYLNAEAYGLSSMISDADTDLSSYLHDRGLRVQEGEEPAQLSEEQRAEVAELCDDVVLVANRKILAAGPTETTLTESAISELFSLP